MASNNRRWNLATAGPRACRAPNRFKTIGLQISIWLDSAGFRGRALPLGNLTHYPARGFHVERAKAEPCWALHTLSPVIRWRSPMGNVLQHFNRPTDNWSISGTTHFVTGFPVTLYDNSDNSLPGTLGNGVNNYLRHPRNTCPGRSRSTPMAAAGSQLSILLCFPKRILAN
jgi:hypothetical protein